MSKTRNNSRGRPSKHGPDAVKVHYALPKKLRDQIDAFRDSTEFPPEVSDVILKAIEEFLAKRGFWPPN